MADNNNDYNQPHSNGHLQDAQGFQSELLSLTQMLIGEEEQQQRIVKKKRNPTISEQLLNDQRNEKEINRIQHNYSTVL